MKTIFLALLLFLSCNLLSQNDCGDDFIEVTFLNDIEKVDAFLEEDIDIDIDFQNKDGLTALMVASYYGNI